MKYKCAFFDTVGHLHRGLSIPDECEDRKKASLFCAISVDQEIPASVVRTGRMVHKVEVSETPDESELVNDLFGIEGIECLFTQPYRISLVRAELAGGGWELIIPRTVGVLNAYVDPSDESGPENVGTELRSEEKEEKEERAGFVDKLSGFIQANLNLSGDEHADLREQMQLVEEIHDVVYEKRTKLCDLTAMLGDVYKSCGTGIPRQEIRKLRLDEGDVYLLMMVSQFYLLHVLVQKNLSKAVEEQRGG